MSTGVVEGSKPETGERYRVEAVARAARILRALDHDLPTDVASIVANAGVPRIVVDALLGVMQRQGLVRRAEASTDHWMPGFAWLHLADVARRQVDLREIALPIMRAMRDDVDETVILAARRGHQRFNIAYVESTQGIRRITQAGFEAPSHTGATGRALLSGMSDRELREYREKLAGGVDVAALIAEIAAVRRDGFARAVREMTPDTAAISAPVRDHAGEIIAALTISCPEDRFTPGLEQACIASCRRGARALSQLLGYLPEPSPS